MARSAWACHADGANSSPKRTMYPQRLVLRALDLPCGRAMAEAPWFPTEHARKAEMLVLLVVSNPVEIRFVTGISAGRRGHGGGSQKRVGRRWVGVVGGPSSERQGHRMFGIRS